MPFKSKKQVRWMFANKPNMAKRWADHTPDIKALPEKAKKKKKKKSALEYASVFFKFAQIGSPNVVVEGSAELQKAVELLKDPRLGGPNYFMNVTKIVADPSGSALGHVESVDTNQADDQIDPNKIFINLGNINAGAQKLATSLGISLHKAMILAAAQTIAHEVGHVKTIQNGKHTGGEAPAEQEEKAILGKIQNIINSLGTQALAQMPGIKDVQ